MRKRVVLFIIGGTIILVGVPVFFALAATWSEDFAGLRDSRGRLLEDIPRVEQELRDLRIKKDDLRQLSRDVERAKPELAVAQRQTPVDERKVQDIQDYINRAAQEIQEHGQLNLDKEINNKRNELNGKQRELVSVETTITNLLNPEIARQKFKRDVSMVFASLVGVVIIGFFAIAWLDDKVRQAIFSGTAGIQFVTLFSLVIAIILFGITSILEGKELAALLGGLSGYILGRVTSERQSTEQQPPQPALQPAVQPPLQPAQAPAGPQAQGNR